MHMSLRATAIIGLIIGMVYLCYLITARMDIPMRSRDGHIIFTLLGCCFFHVVVCVVTYYFDKYPFNNTLQFILCALYPILGYLELFLYYLYFESTCGADKAVRKTIRSFNYAILALNMISTIALLPFGLIFSIKPDGTYVRGSLFAVTYVFLFIALLALIVFTIQIRPSARKTFAYISYSILPIASSVIMVLVNANSIVTDISTMISCVILFSVVYMDERQSGLKNEMKLTEYRTDIMMSQIRPHFIYNTLSTIAALCTVDPEKAQSLTTEFSDYLRTNLNLAKMQKLCTFEEELNHTKQYIDIEKVRFGDRIHVEYDIKETDFLVPSLSLQPLVENAIRHGIMNKEAGGTVWISTEKVQNEYLVTVRDDGVGFDSDHMKPEKGHYGTETTRERLRLLLGGDLVIKSAPNVGTVAKMYIKDKEEL